MKYIIRFSIFYFFLIKSKQICPKWIKMDQTWSNWISDEIIIEIDHQIFKFIYFLIRLNQICPKWIQNGSNLIKLDFWWNYHWNISSDFQFYLFLIRLNQICPKWIKMDQTWSNWIYDEITIEIYHQIFSFIYLLIRLNQICPKSSI